MVSFKGAEDEGKAGAPDFHNSGNMPVHACTEISKSREVFNDC
jgi:hypothetical protein